MSPSTLDHGSAEMIFIPIVLRGRTTLPRHRSCSPCTAINLQMTNTAI
ncbi:MAG: hypothetical protein ACTSRA_02430 [Promethearchaeota archaeon]